MRNLSFYRAAIINPIDDHRASFWPDGVLVTQRSADGISRVLEILDYHHACEKYVEDFGTSNLYEFPQAVILPAFFDMHFHWVQDDVRLMPKDSLLEWLEKYTFPAESKFSSKSYAQRKAKIFFKRLAAMGTLGGACYSSIHPHALDAAMKEAKGHLLIGNVMMTMNSPKALSQTSQEAVRVSVQAMKRYQHRYVLTPRFAISTDPQTMRVTSQEANRRQIFKQSHLSENPDEIKFVLELYRGMKGFKKVKSYTEIYYKVGMLGKRSLMGHAIHLSRSELALLSRTQTALIHCPTSNAPLRQQGLGSGLFNFSQVEKAKIRWALGSDIGGGPYLSMLDVMKSFVRQNHKAGRKKATYTKALYRSTLAGAEILGVSDRSGNLQPKKEANFIVLDRPNKSAKTAEQLLKHIMDSLKPRQRCEQQVRATYYRGQCLWQR